MSLDQVLPYMVVQTRTYPISRAHAGGLVHARASKTRTCRTYTSHYRGRQSNGYRVTVVCTPAQYQAPRPGPRHTPPRFRNNESDTDPTTLATTRFRITSISSSIPASYAVGLSGDLEELLQACYPESKRVPGLPTRDHPRPPSLAVTSVDVS